MAAPRAGRLCVHLFLVLLTFLLGSAPLAAQSPSTPAPTQLGAAGALYDGGLTDARAVEMLSHLPGGVGLDVELQGRYAYALMGNIVEVFDLRNPAQPVLVGTLPTGLPLFFEPTLVDLVVAGQHAFLVLESSIWTFSLADPARPVLQHRTSLAPSYITSVEFQEGALYVTTVQGQLLVLQLQPDGTLKQTGEYALGEEHTLYDLALAGEIGYLSVLAATGTARRLDLQILDLADPTAPHLLTTLAGRGGYKLQLSPDRLYVLDLAADLASYSVTVYERTNPRQLRPLGQLTQPIAHGPVPPAPLVSDAWHDFLLLGVNHQLQILDFGDPSSPQVTATPLETLAFRVAGERAFALVGGLRVYDLTALPALKETGVFTSVVNDSQDLHLADGYAFVKAYAGFSVLDLADPAAPKLAAHLSREVTGDFSRMLAEGTRLYGDGPQEKSVLDIADPRHPLLIARIPHDGALQAVDGNTAYLFRLAGGDVGPAYLEIVDISTPGAWQTRSTLDLSGIVSVFSPASLAVRQGRAYVLTSAGMTVIDVTDSAHPRLLDTFPQVWDEGLLVGGEDYLYILDDQLNRHSRDLQVVDITQRDRPVVRGEMQLDAAGNYRASDALLQPPFLYVLGQDQGLDIVDVADPSLPLGAGHYHTIPSGATLSAAEGLVGVAHGYGATSFYRFTPPDVTTQITPVGGTWSPSDAFSYSLPGGLVSAPISLTHGLRTLLPATPLPAHQLASGIVLRNAAVDAATGAPVAPAGAYTLTIRYAGVLGPFPPETLRLYRWTGQEWAVQASTVDTAHQTVTAVLEQFGVFALLGEPRPLYLPWLR